MKIAETLLEREILDGAEVMALIKGEPIAVPAARRTQGLRGSHPAGAAARRRAARAGLLGRGASATGVIPRFPVYLFDIDGTLLDSAEDICGAVQQVLATTDCSPVTFEFLKGYIGLHLIDLFGGRLPALRRRADRRPDPAVPHALPGAAPSA